MNRKILTATAITTAVLILGGIVTIAISSKTSKNNNNDDNSSNAQNTSISAAPLVTDNSLSITGDDTGFTKEGNVIIITKPGEYTVTGDSNNGQIVVNVDKEQYSNKDTDKVNLILNNVNITNENAPPIYIASIEDKVVIELTEGSVNYLTDTAQREDESQNGVIYAKDDINIKGDGTLIVNANYEDGITCTNDIKIKGGDIQISSVDDAIRGKGSVTIEDGKLTLKAGGDGIKSTETDDVEKGYIDIFGGIVNINSNNDGIQAETSLTISGGNFNIYTHKGADGELDTETAEDGTTEQVSAKALKSGTNITISGGDFELESTDDGIHTNGDITISDGVFSIASSDDGIHADSSVTLDGGSITISESYEGIEAAKIIVNDGYFDITSSDDALNASDGSGSADDFGGDRNPQMPNNNLPDSQFGGERPQRPNGDNFNRDEMGDMPQFEGGEIPSQPLTGESVVQQNSTNQNSSELEIVFNGGTVIVNAEGDGIDSNGSITVNDGLIFVNGPTNSGNGALDCDGLISVNGGTIISIDSGGMSMGANSESSKQASIMFSTDISADEIVSITNSDGDVIFTFSPTKNVRSVYFSSSKIEVGDSYSIQSGGQYSGGTQSDGIYNGGTHKGASALADTVAAISVSQSGMGGFGRR